MTAQMREKLMYNGEEYWMVNEPFSHYVSLKKLDLVLNFTSTALYRGYLGEWEIDDGRLYLTGITGHGKLRNQAKFLEGRLALRRNLKQGLITPQQHGHLLKQLRNDCMEEIHLSLQSLFQSRRKVFSEWYTGTLKAPFGELLQYVHALYGSIYEKTMFITVENGVVTGQWVEENHLDGRSSAG